MPSAISARFGFVARDNPAAATRLVDEIMARFAMIGRSPEMGRDRGELRMDLRSHPVGNYVIYYRIARTHIGVLRVVHGARDPKRIFKR